MSSAEKSDSRTPKLPRLAAKHVIAAKAGRAALRVAAHTQGEHVVAPSALCEMCK